MTAVETVGRMEPTLLEGASAPIADALTPKGAVSLRFPARSLDLLFPQLFPET